MFPGNRPASVTVDPEVDYTTKAQKAPFPGARAQAVTADPQRDGDTNAQKTTALPFGLPFGNAVTHLPENVSTAHTDDTTLGGEDGEAGVTGDGASHQGAEAPDHQFSQDGGPARSYTDPDAVPASLQGVDTPDHAGVAGEQIAPFLTPDTGTGSGPVTDDPEHG